MKLTIENLVRLLQWANFEGRYKVDLQERKHLVRFWNKRVKPVEDFLFLRKAVLNEEVLETFTTKEGIS